MGKVIVICGLPGTGKTTLANALSERLKICCLHKDTLKESLFESFGMSSLEASKQLGYPSVKAILDLAEDNISRGVDIIMEAPFTVPEDKAIFDQWKLKYEIDFFALVLKIGTEERKRRFIERERHKAHHDNDRLRLAKEGGEEECTYDHIPEMKLVLTTNKPVEELVDEVVRFIQG